MNVFPRISPFTKKTSDQTAKSSGTLFVDGDFALLLFFKRPGPLWVSWKERRDRKQSKSMHFLENNKTKVFTYCYKLCDECKWNVEWCEWNVEWCEIGCKPRKNSWPSALSYYLGECTEMCVYIRWACSVPWCRCWILIWSPCCWRMQEMQCRKCKTYSVKKASEVCYFHLEMSYLIFPYKKCPWFIIKIIFYISCCCRIVFLL